MDISIANSGMQQLIHETCTEITKLNTERGAEIVMYETNINSPTGEPILRYINDLEFGRITWWQADNLTKDWFPHPRAVQSP